MMKRKGEKEKRRRGAILGGRSIIILLFSLSPLLLFAAQSGCGKWRIPGKPVQEEDQWKPETSVLTFHELYRESCLACHGDGVVLAPSLPMNLPLYLKLIPEAQMRQVIAEGISGTGMPAFSRARGGLLTSEQIDALIKGIEAWGAGEVAPNDLPPYAAALGDVDRGRQVYNVACARCHGVDGKEGTAGSIIDPAYLGLVSDQYLRTVTTVGRPDLGMPDYRHYLPNRSLSEQEIADVVAWMASYRKVYNTSNRRNETSTQ